MEYLLPGTTISSPYYASIIERLCCAILEKHDGEVNDGVLLLHDNAPIHKCNIVQTAIEKTVYGVKKFRLNGYFKHLHQKNFMIFIFSEQPSSLD